MHTWQIATKKDRENLISWVKSLADYNFHYSKPLDLDFLLLSAYEDYYLSHIPSNGGPQIPDKITEPEKFSKKVESAVQATLKSELAKGEYYSDEQKEKMIYYNYLFLGRGKPTTHMQTLSEMTDKELLADMPPVLQNIFKKMSKILEIPNEKD